MSRHEIKQNDTRPYWPVTLTYDDGTAVDLTGASVRFLARDRTDGVVKITANATITSEPDGELEWRPDATETEVAGLFDCEWEVTFSDGTIQTFPTRRFDRLKIVGEIA